MKPENHITSSAGRVALLAAAILCLSPAISLAESKPAAPVVPSRETQRFVNAAALKENDQLALSQIAVQRANNQDVRAFAQDVLAHHQKENAELMSIAVTKGVKLDFRDMGSSSVPKEPGSENAPTGGSGSGPAPADSSREPPATSSPGITTGNNATDSTTAELERKQGAEFDRTCVDQMIKAHKAVVDLFQGAANKSDDPEIKAYVAKYLPTLQEHQQMAQQLKIKLAQS